MTTMHANTMASWEQMDLPRRQTAICGVIAKVNRPMTDRQITEALGRSDLNFARPTITRLIDLGILEEIGDTRCPTTGRRVRLVFWSSHGQPRTSKPDLLEHLKTYYRLAERERAQLLRPDPEWSRFALLIKKLI